MTNARAIWLCFRAFLSPPAPCLRLHGALTTGHYSPAPRPTLHAPRASMRRYQRGQVVRRPSPHWLLPDTDRRFVKDRTGPNLDERSLYIQYVTEPGDSFGKSIRFSPLAAARPLTIRSWPEALNASGSRGACRMAISRNGRPLFVCPPCPWFAYRSAITQCLSSPRPSSAGGFVILAWSV